MSAAISPTTHRPYGVQRVCRIWAVPRSTFYRLNLLPGTTLGRCRSSQAAWTQAAGR